MATQFEEIITRYKVEDAYTAATMRMAGATKTLAKTVSSAQAKMASGGKASAGSFLKGIKDALGQGLRGVQMPGLDDFTNLGKMAIGALAGVATAAGVAGIAAMKNAGDFDALVKSLEAIEGSAGRAKTVLSELREIAKLPGIELQDAIQSFVNLKRSDLGGDFAKRIIEELGNANAMGGGGAAEFSQVMRAITQIANKPFLQGDELVQLMEAGIPAYKLIKDIFGTTDTEQLKKQGIDSRMVLEGLVKSLSKMPRVAGGAKNDFENLGAAITQATVAAGSALNTVLLPRLNEVTKVLEDMTEGGVIQRAFEDIAEMIGGLGGETSTEDLLYGILVEAKTMAAGLQNLFNNAEGATNWFQDAWEWLTKPRGGPELEQWEKNKREAANDGAESLSQMRQRFIDEMEGEKARRQKEREKEAKEVKSPTSKPNETPAKVWAPIVDTARNTARMVQLQQKQNDISQQILGGGGRTPIDAVTLGNLRSGRGGGKMSLDQAIRFLVAAVHREGQNAVMTNLLTQARR